jgi:ELWxxDGT repeat protein
MPKDNAKNFLQKARKVSLSNSQSRFKDFIGQGDHDDLYEVRLASRSSFNLDLSRLKSDADVEFYALKRSKNQIIKDIGKIDFSDLSRQQIKRNLSLVSRSRRGGKKSENVSISDMEAGTYYVRVMPRDAEKHSTKYQLTLAAADIVLPSPVNPGTNTGDSTDDSTGNNTGGSTGGSNTGSNTGGGNGVPTPLPSSDGNNSPSTPQAITVDFRSRQYQGYVGDDDEYDYYQFTIQNGGDFALSMTGLTADADVALRGSQGQTLSLDSSLNPPFSNSDGSSNESINYRLDSGGTYTILVSRGTEGNNTNYTFTVSVIPGPDGAGNTFETARVLRDLSANPAIDELTNTSFTEFKRFSDFVGGADLADYYKINIENSDFYLNLDLNDLSDDLDLEIFKQLGNQQVLVDQSNRVGTAAEGFGGSFEAGIYYIKVAAKNGNNNIGSFYNLDVAAIAINDIPTITRDIKLSTAGSEIPSANVKNITAVTSGEVYFTADDGAGEAIWISDGTYETTRKLDTGGISFSDISNLTNIGNTVFFAANGNDGNGVELWSTTGSGIQLVANINLDSSSSPNNFINVGGTLYFLASVPGSTNQLYKYSNGEVSAVTTTLTEIGDLTNVNGVLYFVANDPETFNSTLYRVTSSSYETVTVPLPTSFDPGAYLSDLTAVGSNLYFVTAGSTNGENTGREIWKVTNSATSAQLVGETRAGADSASPTQLINVNGTLFFVAQSEGGGTNQTELWKLTGDTPTQLTIGPGSTGLQPAQLTVVGNTLYFTASDDTNGVELWKYDGTTASMVKDINVGGSSTPLHLTAVGNTLYFTADNGVIEGDEAVGRELWKTDGTVENTKLVYDIWIGDQSSIPSNAEFVNANGRLFFTATNGDQTVTTTAPGSSQEIIVGKGVELWVVGEEIDAL